MRISYQYIDFSVHLTVPMVIFVVDCSFEGVTLESATARARLQPQNTLGENIYLQPSQNSLHTLIAPQKCLTIIIILAVVRLFSAKLRLENSRPRRDHCY